jgi:hypothetical protein
VLTNCLITTDLYFPENWFRCLLILFKINLYPFMGWEYTRDWLFVEDAVAIDLVFTKENHDV